jgi:hypothetical protein
MVFTLHEYRLPPATFFLETKLLMELNGSLVRNQAFRIAFMKAQLIKSIVQDPFERILCVPLALVSEPHIRPGVAFDSLASCSVGKHP